MLASIPTPSRKANSNNTQMMTSRRYFNNYRHMEWPLNESEENLMTLATFSQINSQKKAPAVAQLSNNSWKNPLKARTTAVVRCATCHRKFHSQGNLANHKQLYQH